MKRDNINLMAEGISTRLRILIADDIQETRRDTRVMLGLIPDLDVVAIARNGKEAVEMAQESDPDIAIMDINMPDVDGLSAYEVMREQNPDIACIVISGEKDSETLRRAMSVGATDYLIKPFTVDELIMAVYKVGKEIVKRREEKANLIRIRKQREEFITQLAEEYARSRRVDDKAVAVFEHLARNPRCELHWLRILSMIYIIRKDWSKLKTLAARLEKQNKEVDL
jgi:YesN/AraC family two-component response regulator